MLNLRSASIKARASKTAVLLALALITGSALANAKPQQPAPRPSSDAEMMRQVQETFKLIQRNESTLSKPEYYQPTGRLLALYCQSNDSLFPETLDYAWFPIKLQTIGLPWGNRSSQSAFVEFGGGFYHYGYSLAKDEAKSRGSVNTWRLVLHHEDQNDVSLWSFTTPKSSHLNSSALLKQLDASYSARLKAFPDRVASWQSRIEAHLRYGEAESARKVARNMLSALPNNWWAQLINALITSAGNFQKGEAAFLTAVKNRPSFQKYLDLAYFYRVQNRKTKAFKSLRLALQYNPNEEGDNHQVNAYAQAYPEIKYAFEQGQYQLVVDLCNRLIGAEREDYFRPGYKKIRIAAEKRLKKQPSLIKWDTDMMYDPFDIESGWIPANKLSWRKLLPNLGVTSQ